MISTFVFLLLCILLSAFFSGVESAFLSTNKLSLEVLKNKGSARGKILTDIYEDPRTFLSTMLVGNTLAIVCFTLVLGPILFTYLESKLVLSNGGITILTLLILSLIIILFGEFLPKVLFRTYANEWIYRLAYPLKVVTWLLKVPSYLVTSVASGVLKIFNTGSTIDDDAQVSKYDLEHYITHSVTEEKEIDKEILNNALHLNQLKVKECMVPRNEIVYVDISDDIQTIRAAFVESKLSRVIVVDGDIENIEGYLHHQQLYKNITNIKRHIMDIGYVPDVMNVQDLMYKFMKDGTNIACIVDEFGGTAGIITLEDILEEIFGEIADEHDDAEEFVETEVAPGEYLFSGRLEISYINDKYDLELPDEDYVTLSGYIVMTHGSIPEIGQIIHLEDYNFEVVTKSDTKIDLLRVSKIREEIQGS
jgi:putative hemolysin